jgi:cytochrome c553
MNPAINPALTGTVNNNTAVLALNTAYPANFGYAAATQVITPAAAGTLVNSPITAACAACHDTPTAVAHFRANGGSFYAPRPAAGVLPANVEQCMLCHGNGKTADIRVVHLSFK